MDIQFFLNPEGRVSSTRTTRKYFERNLPEELLLIEQHSTKIGLHDVKFSEEIYHYIHGLSTPVVCTNCAKVKPKFCGLLNGYLDYCSSKCSNGSKQVKDLKEKSYLKKYGVSNPSQAKEVVDKIKETFDLKYGGNPFRVLKDKIKETNLERYGAKHPLSKDSELRKSMSKELLERFVSKYKDLEVLDYEEIKTGTCTIRCKVCSSNFTISKWNLHQRVKNARIENPCTVCNPIGSSSETGIEIFVKKILEDNSISFVEKDRKILAGKEIDFYLPQHRVGIEVNGLYWHSELFKDKSYHLEKTKLAAKNGIHIVHIFEDEIKERPSLVTSRIKSILGIYDRKIFARKCTIREISGEDSKAFLELHHMQGKAGAKIHLGLFFAGELVSVMTFGDLRISLGSKKEDNSWELIRFANKMGYSVIGGASKLLKHFIGAYSPAKIISYCDRRWSNGQFYEKIGFVKIGETVPNYWYVSNSGREGRYNYRKDKLVEAGYPMEKTESEIMRERGFLKIYDCGSYKFLVDTSGKTC